MWTLTLTQKITPRWLEAGSYTHKHTKAKAKISRGPQSGAEVLLVTCVLVMDNFVQNVLAIVKEK